MNIAAEWDGPGASARRRPRFRWSRLLWALVYPRRGQQLVPTLPGLLLIALALGIGTAAYNSANNILFITLALLLACVILSGVLSALNFARVRWRFLLPPGLRAGRPGVVGLELHNGKSFLPTYGLDCSVAATGVVSGDAPRPQSTFTAKGHDVKSILSRAGAAKPEVLRLGRRLDPQTSAQVDWTWTPPRRGRWRLELRQVGSCFPFGFFNKKLTAALQREVTVWPSPVEYRRHRVAGARWASGRTHAPRAGAGTDLLALRRYAVGDSHRLIHWKASARTGQLLVRQFAAETLEHFTLRLDTAAAQWPRPEQFERAVSLAATLAEDLFRAGALRAVAIDGETPLRVRQVRDLEAWLDRLALVGPTADRAGPAPHAGRPGELVLAPDGVAGVAALHHGEKAATA